MTRDVHTLKTKTKHLIDIPEAPGGEGRIMAAEYRPSMDTLTVPGLSLHSNWEPCKGWIPCCRYGTYANSTAPESQFRSSAEGMVGE